MTTYVAFLRGVNLGPQRKVSMPRLVELARALGYEDVWTWVNTGNLVLTTDRGSDVVEREVAEAVEQEYGSPTDVTVRTADELRALADANPFPDGSPSQVTVTFLMGPAADDAEQRLARTATAAEPFRLGEREVWVHYGDGLGRSRLAVGFSRAVGVSSTTRTFGTVRKIVEKIDARSGRTPASA